MSETQQTEVPDPRFVSVFNCRGGQDEFLILNGGEINGNDESKVRHAAIMFGLWEGTMLGFRFTGEVIDRAAGDVEFVEGRDSYYPRSLFRLAFIRGPVFDSAPDAESHSDETAQ